MTTDIPRKTASRIIIYLVTFLMGGIGIAYEYTFSKISSDLLGNSVQQWAIIIGIMMFCMGVGADIQKYLSDRKLPDFFLFFEVLLAITGGFGPLVLLAVFGSARDYFVLVQYGLTVAVGLLIGLEIPILTRLNERFAPELKINIGGILRMDYTGAFAGALLWLFLLLRFFSLTRIGIILGFFNVVGAAVAYGVLTGRFTGRTVALTLVTTVALVAGFMRVPEWTARSEQRLFRDEVIFSATTPYQHIVLTRSPAGDTWCYINGNLQFAGCDEYIYHELLVHPAMHIAPCRKRICIMGGGDGLALREVLKYRDVESVVLVDIDPEMTALARTNPHLVSLNHGSLLDSRVEVAPAGGILQSSFTEAVWMRDRRYYNAESFDTLAWVHIYNIDAAKFVASVPGIFDVIIADFPDPSFIELSKLYSFSFYRNVGKKLSRNGIMVQQSSSPVLVKEAFLCIGRTMTAAGLSVIPYHDNVPSFGEWGWWIGGHGEAWTEERVAGALGHIDTLPVPTEYLTGPAVARTLVFGKNMLDAQENDINTLLNSRVFTFYRRGMRCRE